MHFFTCTKPTRKHHRSQIKKCRNSADVLSEMAISPTYILKNSSKLLTLGSKLHKSKLMSPAAFIVKILFVGISCWIKKHREIWQRIFSNGQNFKDEDIFIKWLFLLLNCIPPPFLVRTMKENYNPWNTPETFQSLSGEFPNIFKFFSPKNILSTNPYGVRGELWSCFPCSGEGKRVKEIEAS